MHSLLPSTQCPPVRPSTDPLNLLSSFGIVGLVVDEQGGLEFFPVRTYFFIDSLPIATNPAILMIDLPLGKFV